MREDAPQPRLSASVPTSPRLQPLAPLFVARRNVPQGRGHVSLPSSPLVTSIPQDFVSEETRRPTRPRPAPAKKARMDPQAFATLDLSSPIHPISSASEIPTSSAPVGSPSARISADPPAPALQGTSSLFDHKSATPSLPAPTDIETLKLPSLPLSPSPFVQTSPFVQATQSPRSSSGFVTAPASPISDVPPPSKVDGGQGAPPLLIPATFPHTDSEDGSTENQELEPRTATSTVPMDVDEPLEPSPTVLEDGVKAQRKDGVSKPDVDEFLDSKQCTVAAETTPSASVSSSASITAKCSPTPSSVPAAEALERNSPPSSSNLSFRAPQDPSATAFPVSEGPGSNGLASSATTPTIHIVTDSSRTPSEPTTSTSTPLLKKLPRVILKLPSFSASTSSSTSGLAPARKLPRVILKMPSFAPVSPADVESEDEESQDEDEGESELPSFQSLGLDWDSEVSDLTPLEDSGESEIDLPESESEGDVPVCIQQPPLKSDSMLMVR
ncbi:hypothetical protein EIP91_008308 [Steccherinum ochraceum]|uniref:Uncharacterized protein n=1 Tax=Steccherinum ochraceum TaxID=92696 RepID=A0A4R0R309_9APHY|nr:hypothetical protein EIP91_008308 [Steccherinum ochraceum]